MSGSPSRRRASITFRFTPGVDSAETGRQLSFLLERQNPLAALVVLVGGGIYIASLPKTDALAGPAVCTYYKDASYRKAVGGRGTGCCGAIINWGVTSAYKKCDTLLCTDQICPN